jgi:hypothetical protein
MTGTSMLTRDVSIADAAIVGVGLDAQVIRKCLSMCAFAVCMWKVSRRRVINRIHISHTYTLYVPFTCDTSQIVNVHAVHPQPRVQRCSSKTLFRYRDDQINHYGITLPAGSLTFPVPCARLCPERGGSAEGASLNLYIRRSMPAEVHQLPRTVCNGFTVTPH